MYINYNRQINYACIQALKTLSFSINRVLLHNALF